MQAEISSSIHFHWEHQKQRSMLKPVCKPKATRSAFAIQGVTLNGEELLNVSDIPDVTETGAAIARKPKTPSKKNKHRKNQKDNWGRNHSNQSSSCDRNSSNCSCSPRPDRKTNRWKREPCIGWGGLSYNFSKCYLALGPDSDLITDEARKIFQYNMKAASFRKRVDDLRKTTESNSDKWRGADWGSTQKLMYRVSAFSQFDLNARSHNKLLDFAASVHVFNIKEKFSNFKRALKGQSLLWSRNVIFIEGWGQISLPLKVKSQIKLLTLNNVAYISNFLLNFVSLGCLQKRGFDWSHCLGKISNNNHIIRYTRFYGNNYEIGDDENDGIAFATLAMEPATLRNSQPYHRSHSAATSDTWHHKIGQIGPLGLQMLGKECLGVRLRGKKMFQCVHFAVSKISQQVSSRPPSNQSTRNFQIIYIDWLDLEDGWNSYQSDRAVVGRAMVAVCKATGMAVIYFTHSAYESQNLPLTQNLVKSLAKHYNLDVKVIRSDNEMNRIQKTEWCNQNGISFEPCASDTHHPNGGAERFGQLVMEKARATHLSANITHKLWRKLCLRPFTYTTKPYERQMSRSPLMSRFKATFLTMRKSPAHENRFFTTSEHSDARRMS